jgi:hypothetical protein
MTLEEYAQRILRPAFIRESREFFFEETGIRVTSLVWYGGRYRAMPK